TDNHLMLVNLTNRGLGGRHAAKVLNDCGVELNANAIPFDPRKPFDPSGLRIGVPSITSRGMTEAHMADVARFIDEGLQGAARVDPEGYTAAADFVAPLRARVQEFCGAFPAPGIA
ncbi:MAG: serine hydroxymethyltransferase, partial [Myxococcales bacterium]|nr:serine hydroxymethyltransferase [Myxococcales bacterium]